MDLILIGQILLNKTNKSMSAVTNLIIACSGSEREHDVIAQFSKFSDRGSVFKIESVHSSALKSNWYGGNKKLECNLFIGAYNYLPLDELIEFMKTDMSWDDIETVQIMVKEPNDDRFRIINLVEEI